MCTSRQCVILCHPEPRTAAAATERKKRKMAPA
jgi:hypothetical protein